MGFVPGATNIPVSQLRKRIGEVPQGKKLYVYCQVGQGPGRICWVHAGAAPRALFRAAGGQLQGTPAGRRSSRTGQ